MAVQAVGDRDKSGGFDFEEFRKLVTPGGNWSDTQAAQVFQTADKNNDGHLSADEITESFAINTRSWPGLQSILAKGHWTQSDMQRFVKMGDSNGDGVVTSSEWQGLHNRLDADGDGQVTEEELKLGASLASAQGASAERLLKSADKDGDGYIAWDEAGQSLAWLSPAQTKRFMAMADSDGDGRVSEAELQQFIKAHDKDGDGELSDAEWKEALNRKHSPLAEMALRGLQTRFVDRHLKPESPRKKFVYEVCSAALCSYVAGGSVIDGATKELQRQACRHAMRLATTAPSVATASGAQGSADLPASASASSGGFRLEDPRALADRRASGADDRAAQEESPLCRLCGLTDANVNYRPCGHRILCTVCYGRQLCSGILTCPDCGSELDL